VVGPHVDDRRGDGDGRRRVEDTLDESEIADRRPAETEPRRGIPERFGLNDELGAVVIAVARVEPGADPAQLQTGGRGAHQPAAAPADTTSTRGKTPAGS